MAKRKSGTVARVFLSHSSKDAWICELLNTVFGRTGPKEIGASDGGSGTKARVFISHSNEDRELARDLAERLVRAGLEPFLNTADAAPRPSLRKQLLEQIRGSDAALFLVTPAALRSDWMMAELGMAEGLERVIVPVTAGLKSVKLPAPFQTLRAFPFDEADTAISTLALQLRAASKN